MPNLQKKRLLIFEIFNIKKCTLFFFFFEPSILISLSMHPSVQHTPSIHQYNVCSSVHLTICLLTRLFIHLSPIHFCVCKLFHPSSQPVSQPANQSTNQPTNENNNWTSKNTVFNCFYHSTKSRIFGLFTPLT